MSESESERVRAAMAESAELHRRVGAERVEPIVQASVLMRDALVAGRRVLVFGNGGSATDAQHFAAELVGRFERERRPVAALALAADIAVLTAIGNDYGYDHVFARQVDAIGQPGDVALAITTSGQSRNVNLAIEHARARQMPTIGLTGKDGGETGRLVDIHVNVPGRTTARAQEVQRTILHVMCACIEERL